MAPTEELFRFVTTRPPNRVIRSRIESRLIRDRRSEPELLGPLFGPGDFEPKLRVAAAYAASADFLAEDDPLLLGLHPVVDFLRRELVPGRPLEELADDFAAAFPLLARLLQAVPPENLAEQTRVTTGRLWTSLYALVTLGGDRFVSTNHVVDALRTFHVLLLMWVSRRLGAERWNGGRFDDYHPIIDLQAAAARSAAQSADRAPGRATGELPPLDDVPVPGGGPQVPTVPAGPAGGGSGGSAGFRVDLKVGELFPPTVGDLVLVEQELREYQLGEVARIESIMIGERRERTTRTLARTSQTTTTETSSEQEESSTSRTEERFQLASQAQQTAEQSVGVDVGVSVSAKFGPVQVGATANASFDTAESSTDTTSQDFARTVTEEATKRVRTSFKQTTSVTLLTETQDTTLQGFDNRTGTEHVNGLYRWVDKLYEARSMNYGRRLMLSFSVPEPAQSYRGLTGQAADKLRADLVEPVHPAELERGAVESFADIDEETYAELAAVYGVTDVGPPPPRELTGGKTIVVPAAAPPTELKDDELSVVLADAGLTVDPDYRLVSVGVFAPDGSAGNLRDLANVLHLGERKDETDRILVMVGHHDFHLEVTGQGDNDPKKVDSNFNSMRAVTATADPLFDDLVQTGVPITVSAACPGMFSLNVLFSAVRTDEALDRWKAETYAAVLQGYAVRKQAYDQALAAARAQARTVEEARTVTLRDDQYRAVELTELKRGCLELLTEGTATGHPSIKVDGDGTPTIIFDEADATGLPRWRSPLAAGTVADFLEQSFEWPQATYKFLPYYWGGERRWPELAQATSPDPVFEAFLQAGSASVVVPVRPGFERPVLFFLKTGRVWGGRYLPLFSSPDMLDAYADVELCRQLDPPVQVGDSWEVRLPTSMVMLQSEPGLPSFPPTEPPPPAAPAPEPLPGDNPPF